MIIMIICGLVHEHKSELCTGSAEKTSMIPIRLIKEAASVSGLFYVRIEVSRQPITTHEKAFSLTSHPPGEGEPHC